MITIVEYARRKNMSPNHVRDKANLGLFETAVKIDGTWMVDENEPFPADRRYRNGNYVDWRKKYPARGKNVVVSGQNQESKPSNVL